MESNSSDYLKYWRTINFYYRTKNDLSQAEIDMLLFLKSEKYFRKKKFEEFDKILSWDKHRFKKLVAKGWIQLFRGIGGPSANIYELSMKANRMLNEMYRKLNGEEITISGKTPLLKKKISYHSKMYIEMIQEMNQVIRQQRHRTHE